MFRIRRFVFGGWHLLIEGGDMTTNSDTLRKLSAKHTAAFDTEYVDEAKWRMVTSGIEESFPSGSFRFLDVGGGNGRFCDRVLEAYPGSTAVLLDNSQQLLSRNTPHPRKTMAPHSVERIDSLFSEKFDLIFFNWVLHHIVADNYATSRRAMSRALMMCSKQLRPGGKVSILENLYDGLLIDSLPSRLIYFLTSSRMLQPLTSRFGANTAGVGVCFLSRVMWQKTIEGAGLKITRFTDDVRWSFPFYKRALLHLGRIRVGHFWCRPRES
jgi:SAM-dependent methyltransferase